MDASALPLSWLSTGLSSSSSCGRCFLFVCAYVCFLSCALFLCLSCVPYSMCFVLCLCLCVCVRLVLVFIWSSSSSGPGLVCAFVLACFSSSLVLACFSSSPSASHLYLVLVLALVLIFISSSSSSGPGLVCTFVLAWSSSSSGHRLHLVIVFIGHRLVWLWSLSGYRLSRLPSPFWSSSCLLCRSCDCLMPYSMRCVVVVLLQCVSGSRLYLVPLVAWFSFSYWASFCTCCAL